MIIPEAKNPDLKMQVQTFQEKQHYYNRVLRIGPTFLYTTTSFFYRLIFFFFFFFFFLLFWRFFYRSKSRQQNNFTPLPPLLWRFSSLLWCFYIFYSQQEKKMESRMFKWSTRLPSSTIQFPTATPLFWHHFSGSQVVYVNNRFVHLYLFIHLTTSFQLNLD